MGTPEVAARAADRPPQLPSTDEALLFADIEVNAAASPHSAEYKEFVETQLEVVGHAFGARCHRASMRLSGGSACLCSCSSALAKIQDRNRSFSSH